MKNHHEVGHFKTRLMILLLSLVAVAVMAGESIAATTCSTCHGMPPLDSADGLRKPATGAFRGNHQIHLGATATAAECSKCHANAGYTNDHAAISGNKINMAANINASPAVATYSKAAPFDQTATPVMGSCSNVNCHFEKTGGSAPVWGTVPVSTDCNTCHATPRGASGSHAKHEAKYGCEQCHPNYGTTNFSHATSAGKDKIKVNAANGYTGGSATSWLPSQTKQFGTCATAACHDNGRGVSVATPTWGDSSAPACSICHEAAPTTFSHTKHLTGLSGSFSRNAVCADCHKDYVQGTTTTADHIDGNVDVYSALPGDLGYTANKAKGSALASCSTSNCHSNGRSSFATVTWDGSSTGCNFCHPTLTGKHSVHTNLATAAYGSTADNSTAGSYNFGCGNCHPTSVSSHLNGTIDLTLNKTHGGPLKSKNDTTSDGAGYTQNAGVSVTCAAAYCHSNGMATPTFYGDQVDWYQDPTGDKCALCHGNSPNTGGRVGSTAHSVHTVGIHYTDIFNGVSKKLPQSGGQTVNAAHGRNNRSTTINCNICHALTVNSFGNDQNTDCVGCHTVGVAGVQGDATIADKSMHVNGTVDIRFIDQTIATKAQVANTAFAGYTATNAGWSRNNNIYKTYTSGYDVTKNTLFTAASYSQSNGCLNVACHSGITVKWTDSVSCTSCHTRLK